MVVSEDIRSIQSESPGQHLSQNGGSFVFLDEVAVHEVEASIGHVVVEQLFEFAQNQTPPGLRGRQGTVDNDLPHLGLSLGFTQHSPHRHLLTVVHSRQYT